MSETNTTSTNALDDRLRKMLSELPPRLRLLVVESAEQVKANGGDSNALIASSQQAMTDYTRATEQLAPIIKETFGRCEQIAEEITPAAFVHAFISREDTEQAGAMAVYCTDIDEPYKYPVLLIVTPDDKNLSAILLLTLLMDGTAPKEGDPRIGPLPIGVGEDASGLLVALIAEKNEGTGRWFALDGDAVECSFDNGFDE